MISHPGIVKDEVTGLFVGDGEFKPMDEQRSAAGAQGDLAGKTVGPDFGVAPLPAALGQRSNAAHGFA